MNSKEIAYAIGIGFYNYICLSVFIMGIMTYAEDFVKYNPYLSVVLLAVWLVVTNVLIVFLKDLYE